MQCSGLPELCTVLAGLTMRSHAGHVLKQIANSLSELTQVSLTSAKHEIRILGHEGKTEELRHVQGAEELRLIKAEVRDNEQLTLTLHGLLIDLQTRTDQTIDDQCAQAVETLEEIVHDFSEVEGSKLVEMIEAGNQQRVWTCDTSHLRRMIERIAIEPDEAVAYPAAVAEITLTDGTTAELSERRKFTDFSLGRADVKQQLLRLAAEEGLPGRCVELLEGYAFASDATPAAIVEAFSLARGRLERAATLSRPASLQTEHA